MRLLKGNANKEFALGALSFCQMVNLVTRNIAEAVGTTGGSQTNGACGVALVAAFAVMQL